MIPLPIIHKLIEEAQECLWSGNVSQGQLDKFRNGVRYCDDYANSITLQILLINLTKESEKLEQLYEEALKDTDLDIVYINFYYAFVYAGLYDLALKAAIKLYQIVGDDNIQSMRDVQKIMSREGLIDEFNQIGHRLVKVRANDSMKEFDVSVYGITKLAYQAMIKLVRETLKEFGVFEKGGGLTSYDDDGELTLSYSIITGAGNPDLLADMQIRINEKLVDYEIEHEIAPHNVIFSVE